MRGISETRSTSYLPEFTKRVIGSHICGDDRRNWQLLWSGGAATSMLAAECSEYTSERSDDCGGVASPWPLDSGGR
jgi:hypothetical protein